MGDGATDGLCKGHEKDPEAPVENPGMAAPMRAKPEDRYSHSAASAKGTWRREGPNDTSKILKAQPLRYARSQRLESGL